MTYINLIKRVCQWNAARYEQEYNSNLTKALIQEEFDELCEADTDYDMLDALGDIWFVAVGGMWKCGFTPEFIYFNLDTAEENYQIPPMEFCIDQYLKSNQHDEVHLAFIINAVNDVIHDIAKGPGAAIDVFDAICTSNETKIVQRAASHVKANTTKGDSFVPPTADLQRISMKINSGYYDVQ